MLNFFKKKVPYIPTEEEKIFMNMCYECNTLIKDIDLYARLAIVDDESKKILEEKIVAYEKKRAQTKEYYKKNYCKLGTHVTWTAPFKYDAKTLVRNSIKRLMKG